MDSKNKSLAEGGTPADDTAGEDSSNKKRKINDESSSSSNAESTNNNDDLLYQEMASLIAKKVIQGGWPVSDESKLTKFLAEVIKSEDLQKQGELQQEFESNKDKWAPARMLWGCRQYMAELERHGAELERHGAGLERHGAELKRHAAELQPQAEVYYACSIQRWIDLSEMKDNVAKTELDMEIKRAAGSPMSSHVNTGHKTQTAISPGDFKLDKIPQLSEVVEKKASLLPSNVLTRFYKRPGTYTNEADVHSFVGRAIDDAVAYMNVLLQHNNSSNGGPSIELNYRTECSMFSNRPDHFVISAGYQKYHTMFPVETKKEHKAVFTSDSVASQVCDYTMLNKMLTGRPSLAILTTFNQSKIVWDGDCKDVVETEGRFTREALKKTVDSIINTMKRSNESIPEPPVTANDDDYTTPQATTKHSRTPLTDSPPELVEAPKEEANHKIPLIYSKDQYNPYQLLSVLCNVVIASLNKGLDKIKTQTGNLQDGQTILVLKGKERKIKKKKKKKKREPLYEWRAQRGEVNVADSWMDFKDSQEEYLVRTIAGVGSTSRCWGAVVIPDDDKKQEGFSCVVKYWIKIWDKDTKEYMQEKTIEKESRETTGEEVENYKKIYGDIFFPEGRGGCVGQKKLNNTYCVILPFFKPITKEERKEGKVKCVLDEVREVLLNRFYNKDESKSYQFIESDQRWSHIGRWTGPSTEQEHPSGTQEHLVLFDLADLQIVENVTRDQHSKYVQSHVATLLGSLGFSGPATD